ncbi:nickel/cobalt transporter [Paracoccus jiaweipingae]|uniref:nickel/cobalt transporter n=1 Tax=Paracoccus sp. p2-l61 TaxID=3366950 RepID=UPI00378B7E98
MRRALIIALAALLALGLGWVLLHPAAVSQWAATHQRDVQNALARALRALKAGDGGAWLLYLGLCFGYGFVHAVGPGHGKFLVGAYGLARDIPARRLATVSALAALGQGLMAIALVGAGVTVLNLSRRHMTELAEQRLAPLSFALIGLIGLWLLWRGARRLWRMRPARGAGPHHAAACGHDHGHDHHHHHHHHHHHDHHHDYDHHHSAPADAAVCPDCGHAHAPSPQAIAAATGWRDMAALIAGIAVRPCSGAVLLLVLTWQMGIFAAGIWGALVMAMGTAALTAMVATASVTLRRGALATLTQAPALRIAAALFELSAGLAIALLAALQLGLA